MAQGKRDRLSAEQRTEMWRRWKAGESLHEIGRTFGKYHGSIQFLLSQRGGIVPSARRRSPRTLTLAEREDISRGIASGSSIRETAKGLQRSVSTVSREVRRHGGRPIYRANEADHSGPGSRLCGLRCVFLPTTLASSGEATAPCGVPSLVSDHWPSSDTPALSHFWIRRSILRSATRCSINFIVHSRLMLSKKPRMSASSTQFTRFRWMPTVSASSA
jgi:DNA-binding CsgD family transcriptional regulator